jgi:hypothetical protein
MEDATDHAPTCAGQIPVDSATISAQTSSILRKEVYENASTGPVLAALVLLSLSNHGQSGLIRQSET